MNRTFTILFFVMALALFVANAMPTEEKVKRQNLDDGGLLGIGLDINGIADFLVNTLEISVDLLNIILQATINALGALLNAVNAITNGNFPFEATSYYYFLIQKIDLIIVIQY